MNVPNDQSLEELVRRELRAIPLEHWSQYFPVQVAVLRFLECRYPTKVAMQKAGFDEQGPWFVGVGVEWFTERLWTRDDVLELVDKFMTATVVDLKQRHPDGLDVARQVALDAATIAELEERVLTLTERAIRDDDL